MGQFYKKIITAHLTGGVNDLISSYIPPFNSIVKFKVSPDDKEELGIVVRVNTVTVTTGVYVHILTPSGCVREFLWEYYLINEIHGNNYVPFFEDLDENITCLKQCDSFFEAVTNLQWMLRDGNTVLEEL